MPLLLLRTLKKVINMVAGTSTISWESTLDIMRELTDLYKGNETDDVADAGMISTMVNDVRKASEEMRSR